MAKPIRIGIIGAGKNTRERHIPGFQALPDVEITLVCNRSLDSSEKVAEEFGIPRFATDWTDVVDDPEVDAICIGTWPYLHSVATIAAIEAGKPVLCEARMASNVEQAEAMMAAHRKAPEVVAQLVPAPFSLDFDARVQDLLANRLGHLREVCVTHTSAVNARHDTPLTWRQDAALSGHNVLTMGIYHEIVLRWIGKNPEWVIADAEIFTPKRTPEGGDEPKDVRVPETVSVLGRFPDGGRLVYHFSGLESGKPRNEIRLNGEKASLRIDFGENQLFLSEPGSEVEEAVTVPDSEKRGWRVEEDFLASIREGKPVELTTFEQGLQYMKFTDAVHQSASAGAFRFPVA